MQAPATTVQPKRGRVGTALRSVSDAARSALDSRRIVGLADQAVVSGTSFATTVAIGRLTYPSQLGLYVLAMSFLIMAINVQSALISMPYTLWLHEWKPGTPDRTGAWLAISLTMSAATATLVLAFAFAMSVLGGDPQFVDIVLAFAGVLPLILLREFARDVGFATFDVTRVLILDSVVGGWQIASLLALAQSDWLNAVTAVVSIGIICGLAGIAWFVLSRNPLRIRSGELSETFRISLREGRWQLSSLFGLVIQVQSANWLLALFAGTAVTGIYAACMSVVSLMNPLVSGLTNTALARAAVAYKEGGNARLRHETARDVRLLGTIVAAFGAAILLGGDGLMRFIYGNASYGGHGLTVLLLVLWQTVNAFGIPLSNALLALGRSRLNFYLGLGGALVSIVIAVALAARLGPVGAALALVVGTTFRTLARWLVLYRPSCAMGDQAE